MTQALNPFRSVRFWLVTLAAVAGIAITLALARWQLDRAAQKEAIHAAIEAEQKAPALDSRALAGRADLAPLLHRRVSLRGHWVGAQTVYLDNRQMYGRPGFYVMTPLRLADDDGVVLVQRGWIPRDFQDRKNLQPVDTPQGDVVVNGRIGAAPSQLYAFGDAAKAQAAEGASRIRQNLDLAVFRNESGLALAEGSIVQTDGPNEGLKRDWPEVASGVEKHYGYAAQWFGLSALMAILYVWFQLIAPRRRARTDR